MESVLKPSLSWGGAIVETFMVTHIAKSMDQPGKVANLARGQLNRDREIKDFPVRVSA